MGHSTVTPKKGVRYPPVSEPLISYGFDLVRWYNFKGFWLPVKQVLNINKKLKHSSRFSAFLLSHVCFSTSLLRLLIALFASLNKTLRARRTHNLKSEALLLTQSNSSTPLSSLFFQSIFKSAAHSYPIQLGGASSLPGRLGGASSLPF